MSNRKSTATPQSKDYGHQLGFDALPDNAFVREAELVRTGSNPTGLLPFSPHTLWRKVREGSFPHPLKLAPRVTAWRVKDVREWMQSCSSQ